MRITVMGALLVIGGIMLVAVVMHALFGNKPSEPGKNDERPNPVA